MVCICYIVTLLIVWHQECSEVERHEQDRQTERQKDRKQTLKVTTPLLQSSHRKVIIFFFI